MESLFYGQYWNLGDDFSINQRYFWVIVGHFDGEGQIFQAIYPSQKAQQKEQLISNFHSRFFFF